MSFSRKEQAAIVVLLFLLIVLTCTNIFIDYLIPAKTYPLASLDSLLVKYPSSDEKKISNFKKDSTASFDIINPDQSAVLLQLKPFYFNPNRLPEAEWRKMGLSERQIKNIKNYEAHGGKFYKKTDFKKIFTISEAEYSVLEPFIKIPPPDSSYSKVNREEKQVLREKTELIPIERDIDEVSLNEADSTQLLVIPGLGPWFAHRIIQYRKVLGGFNTKDQLLEVRGMDSLRYHQIEKYLIIDPSLVQQIRINKLTFKELIKHPYIDFEMTKAVINHREKRGFIQSEQELSKLVGFTQDNINKLSPYLRYD